MSNTKVITGILILTVIVLLWWKKRGVSNNKYFKDKTVWITGASSGIGRQLAILCATYGANLIISGRDIQKLGDVQRECKVVNKNCKIALVPYDIATTKDVKSILDNALSLLAQLNLPIQVDVLINNAGVSSRGTAVETEVSTLQSVFGMASCLRNLFSKYNM